MDEEEEEVLRVNDVPVDSNKREWIVFSKNLEQWFEAESIECPRKGFLTLQFVAEGRLFRKTIAFESNHLRRARMSVGEEEELAEHDPGCGKLASKMSWQWDSRSWQERGDVAAETTAVGTDFVISYTNFDQAENNRILSHLKVAGPLCGPWGNFRRPITFCTDRSLGLGFSFVDGWYAGRTDPRYNDLGPPGQPQTTKLKPWFKIFAQAAKDANYGLLLVNPSKDYFKSRPCNMECGSTGSTHKAPPIPKNRHFIYIKEQDRIVAWKDWNSVLSHVLEQTELITAAERNDTRRVSDLLASHPGLINKVDKTGMSAIMYAAWYGNFDATQLLIDSGADLHVVSHTKATAFHFAMCEKHYDVAKLLLEAGGGPPDATRLKRSLRPRCYNGSPCLDEVAIQMSQFEPSSSDNDSDYDPRKATKCKGRPAKRARGKR